VKVSKYILETKNLTKSFGDIVALRNVNFKVEYNEVMGLVGDNGAGKSTLVKTITGFYAPDSGEIYIKGQRFTKLTPQKARELGIEIVHQERTLAESQPIWRNIFLGRELTGRLGFLKINEMKEASREILRNLKFGAELSPDQLVRTLSGGLKQGVQIGRALYFNADLVILDEPTIQLSISEARRVMEYVKELKERGKSCVFITHNINHVYPVADRFTIMDKGKIVGVFRKNDITMDDLSEILASVARTGSIPEKYREINIMGGEW
jgi:simple sugar transport system ATP-binding protein